MRVRAAFLQTLASQLVQSVASIGTGVLIARSLGPAGQGQYALLTAAVALGSALVSIGQFQGNVLAAASRDSQPRVLLVRSLIHGLAVGVAVAGTLLVWARFVPLDHAGSLSLILTVLLSAETVALMIRGINLGQHHVTAWNAATLAQRVVYLGGVGALVLAGRSRLELVMACWAVATVTSVAVSGIWIWFRSTRVNLSLRELRQGWGARMIVGARALVTLGVTLILIRCDVWMLGPMLGVATVGQMSIAIALGEWLWYVPSILGNLLFAVIAADIAGRSPQQICQGARAVTIVLVPAALVLGLAGQRLVTTLYGNTYAVAGTLFVILLPGMVALGIHLVVDAFFAGKGFPPISIWTAVVALTAKFCLNLLAIPSFGARGAAGVTSLVYIGLLGFKVAAFTSKTGTPLRSVFVPQRSDFDYWIAWARARLGLVAIKGPESGG